MSDFKLEIERVFQAPRQVVFDAWTSTDALKQWHCGTILETVMDLRVGGEFLIRFAPEEGCDHAVVRGNYLEVVKPERLQYTWKWDGTECDTVVTIEFAEHGDHATRMRILHERLDTAKSRDDHNQGWEACLTGLNEYVGAAVDG